MSFARFFTSCFSRCRQRQHFLSEILLEEKESESDVQSYLALDDKKRGGESKEVASIGELKLAIVPEKDTATCILLKEMKKQRVKTKEAPSVVELRLTIASEKSTTAFNDPQELDRCVEMLRDRLSCNKVSKKIIVTASFATLVGSIAHMVYSVSRFDAAVALFASTIIPVAEGMDPRTCGSTKMFFYFNKGFFSEYVGSGGTGLTCNYPSFTDSACLQAARNVCDGPGMWSGYTPVIAIFGIGLPIVIGSTCCAWGRLFEPEYLTSKDVEIVRRCAQRYNIKSTNISVPLLLSVFEEKLTEVNKKRQPKVAFCMGSSVDKRKSKQVPITNFFTDPLFDPKVVNLLFDFSGQSEVEMREKQVEKIYEAPSSTPIKEECIDISGMMTVRSTMS